jgi:hypothetical protein
MSIDRRSFLQGSICSAVLLPLSRITVLQSTAAEILKVSAVAACDPAVFTIYGWDCLDSQDRNENQLCLTLNQSWRTAWR